VVEQSLCKRMVNLPWPLDKTRKFLGMPNHMHHKHCQHGSCERFLNADAWVAWIRRLAKCCVCKADKPVLSRNYTQEMFLDGIVSRRPTRRQRIVSRGETACLSKHKAALSHRYTFLNSSMNCSFFMQSQTSREIQILEWNILFNANNITTWTYLKSEQSRKLNSVLMFVVVVVFFYKTVPLGA
jgi:hypothetical protein